MPSKLLSKLYSSELFVKGEWGSERMRQLAEQLIVYRRPLNFLGRDEDDEGDDCGSGEAGAEGVSSTCGIPEETVKFIHRLPPDVGKKKAAVLVCLFYDEHDELRVLLTRRSKLLSTHSGEVAFPGGKRDEMDANNIETALREAWEEIGLDSSLVRVVTYLEPFLSKHLLRVTPVMALVPDRSKLSLTPNKGEVDAIFDAPLRMFLKNHNHRSEERQWMGIPYVMHYFDYETITGRYLIWGMTAAILIRCASVIYQQCPEFETSSEFITITNHEPT
ncbi:hypothetical protein KP509_08G024700 [Ceratopteris richardii]|uniref:Nudix hydrolase domain-containing protein n=1 Tax=Ceratopteris richardii TaxID=49495 RepID=A0A8T2UBR6_CERRI|nr:hypothetical protein KP509_08G024700 [Ceratopteris richardii]